MPFWTHRCRPARSRLRRDCGVLAASAVAVVSLGACSTTSAVRSGSAGAVGRVVTTTTTVPTTVPDTTVPTPNTTEPAPDTTAVSDTTTPLTTTAGTTTTTPPLDCISPSKLPEIVAADDAGYDTVQVHEGLGAKDDRGVAIFTAGGAVATQVGTDQNRSVEYRIGPAGGIGEAGTIDHAVLYDLVATATGPEVLYGELAAGDPPLGTVRLLDIGTGRSSVITDSAGLDFSVYRAAVANGVVVTSARRALAPEIRTWALDGSGELTRFSPIGPENDGGPPWYGPAVPSPDSKQLAWLEGPVTDGNGNPQGDWSLVVADAVTGTESRRVTFAPAGDTFTWLDWDGEWAVLSRGHGETAEAVHTTDADPQAQPICADDGSGLLTGTVTLVRTRTVSPDAGVALDRQIQVVIGNQRGDGRTTR